MIVCQKIMQNTDTKYQIIRNAQIKKAKAKDERIRKGERERNTQRFPNNCFQIYKRKTPTKLLNKERKEPRTHLNEETKIVGHIF